MQTQESKTDTGKALDADLVITKSSGTKSKVQDDNSRSGNDTNIDDIDIRPIYDEEPMVEEVISRAKIQSHKTRNSNKPVEQKSHTQKPGRHIFTRHRFSPNKTSYVYEKTCPRSDLGTSLTGQQKQRIDFSAVQALHHNINNSSYNRHDSYDVNNRVVKSIRSFVQKYFAVTAADASYKRPQQPNTTSSTSALATTASADENFDL
nr:hypothetical protein [Tanacetum cinerariifolium]